MIFALTLFLILAFPGNTIFYALLLIFCYPHLGLKPEKHHVFFVLWVIWAFLGSLFSSSPLVSFFGADYRMQGWFMLLITARMAWVYWETQTDEFSLQVFCVVSVFLVFILSFLVKGSLVPLFPMAAFCALSGVLLWAMHPSMSLMMLPFIFISDSRSALIAFLAGVSVFYWFKWGWWTRKGWKFYSKIGLAVVSIFLAASIFSPIGKKMANIDFSTFGTGARTHWVRQSWDIVREGKLPVFGSGLEMLPRYLKNPTSGPMRPDGIPDRTHNVVTDVLLMTGWVGLVLLSCSAFFALRTLFRFPTRMNIACGAVFTAWLVYAMINPHSCASHVLALTCFFGIKNDSI